MAPEKQDAECTSPAKREPSPLPLSRFAGEGMEAAWVSESISLVNSETLVRGSWQAAVQHPQWLCPANGSNRACAAG